MYGKYTKNLSAMMFLPIMAFAKPVALTDLLQPLKKGEPFDKSVRSATKTMSFNQQDSGSQNATVVQKMRLGFFTTNNCTGALAGTGAYTTPDDRPFSINLNTPFGAIATAVWNVGDSQLSIDDMTEIQSVAISLYSLPGNIPQANFASTSFSCATNVTCTAGPAGSCTSADPTQDFTLKKLSDDVVVGDPADGGHIASLDPGFELTVPIADLPGNPTYGGGAYLSDANSTTNGTANTAAIVDALGDGDYAAKRCTDHITPGGYSGWILPAPDQLQKIWATRGTIGNFSADGPTNYYMTSLNIDNSPNSPPSLAQGGIFNDTFGTINGPKDFNAVKTRCAKPLSS